MHDKVAVEMMRRCLDTIERQRVQIAYLTPKAEAYDRIGVLLDGQRGDRAHNLGGDRAHNLGGEVDVVWQLRREIEETQQRMSAEKSSARTTRTEPVDEPDRLHTAQEEINLRRSDDTGQEDVQDLRKKPFGIVD